MESIILKTLSSTLSPENLSSAVAEEISKASGEEDDNNNGIRVPKYFQALFTLIVCFLLLFCTLSIIRQTKKACQKSACRKMPLVRIDSDKDKEEKEYEVVVVPEKNETIERGPSIVGGGDVKPRAPRHYDYYRAPLNPSDAPHINTKADENNLLKVKKVKFERRVSGPFGEEAMDFVGQTYKKKVKEVKQAERLGQVQGRIKTHQQSVRKQSKAKTPQV